MSPSSSSSPFRNLGDLLDPNCPIAAAARKEAIAEAELAEVVRKEVEARNAHFARWAAMTRAEKKEAMFDWDGYPEEHPEA